MGAAAQLAGAPFNSTDIRLKVISSPAAVEAGMARAAVTHFDNSADAAPQIASQVTSGDVVLVKGSRGIRTDLIVERLTAVFG